jgi:peptide deformylase
MDNEIVKIGDKILQEKVKKVKNFDKNLRETVQKMKEIMLANNGVGISANQIGLDLAISLARPKDKFYTFINPEVEQIGETGFKEEGCLSIPGKYGLIKRFNKVKIRYQNLQGKRKTLVATGLLAHIIQHELDHLNGNLFIDKATEIYEAEKK